MPKKDFSPVSKRKSRMKQEILAFQWRGCTDLNDKREKQSFRWKTVLLQHPQQRLLIATHLDQSNHLANQQQLLHFAMPFSSINKLCKNAGLKSFC
jgi:hypothetical protein